MIDKEALLQVKDFSISFRMYEKGIKQSNVKAVSNLSLDLYKGEVLAIVGSSGSGKSLLAHGIMGLLPENAITSGCIVYEGEELTEDRLRKLRGAKIALVPQSISYLDPLIKIGKQVQGTNRSKAAQKRQKESFDRYDLCEKSAQLYPFQLSGGMARRGLIATADQKDVDLIIADEPTPGLELELAMKTLKYFRDFANRGKAVLLITHDIDLAFNVADRVAIFYAGTVVEIASAKDFQSGMLRHPYTKALYNALPQNGFYPIDGVQPYGKDLAEGCLFAPRCSSFNENCSEKISLRPFRDGFVRCNNAT